MRAQEFSANIPVIVTVDNKGNVSIKIDSIHDPIIRPSNTAVKKASKTSPDSVGDFVPPLQQELELQKKNMSVDIPARASARK